MTNLVTELIREYERLLQARRLSAKATTVATAAPKPGKLLQRRPQFKVRQPALG